MKNLVYYPSFEPNNDSWIKYALIYLDDFSPIIPDSGEKKISDTFNKIRDLTDVVKIIRPAPEQADLTSLDTLIEIKNIEEFPNQYRDLFKVANIIRKFKDPENWDYEIFSEKYNSDFREELIARGYATESTNGILTSPELAQLFMTLLANRIAQKGNANPITDNEKFDSLALKLNEINKVKTDNFQYLAKSVIHTKLPQHINQIPLQKFIDFRNKLEIQELRNSFNDSLNKFYGSLEENINPQDFITSLENYNTSFSKELLVFFGSLVVVGIDTTTALASHQSIEVFKNLISGSLVLRSVTAIKSAYNNDREIMKSRKFLSEIHKIK